MNFEMEGRFSLKVIGEDGLVREELEFKNVITNNGLDYIGNRSSGAGLFSHMAVGSGNTTPAFTDTALSSWVASVGKDTTPTFGGWDATNLRFSYNFSATFAKGAAAGNLSEVGTAIGATSTSALFSRALIKDGSGNPTVLTVLSTDILTVTYTLYVYPTIADQTVNLTLNGVATSCVSRPIDVGTQGASAGDFGTTNILGGNWSAYGDNILRAITASSASGTGGGSVLVYGVNTYVNGSYQRDLVAAANVSQGNISGGIGAVIFKCGLGMYQVVFTPKIAKDNTKSMTLTFRISWARH